MCKWKKKLTVFGYENWISGCRIEVSFNPSSFKFCPYCGEKIEFVSGTIAV